MKQHEAVIRVMEENGGFATLGYLYANVPGVPDVVWRTKTPFASIRRIVQDPRFFFKIRPGLWALKGWENKLPPEILAQAKSKRAIESEFDHTYYQGLLVEIGNLKHFVTFVPYQDKNRKFLGKPLAQLTSLKTFYPFTYDHLVRRAQTVDVTWFNPRKMPDTFFEVEHSTDIYTSLIKFSEFQDFNVNFRIVADQRRKREFESKVAMAAFQVIAPRVRFMSYEFVSKLHAQTYELAVLEMRL